MKGYQRLTIRHEDGSHSFMYDYNATTPPIKILLDRLAELEDKIENGTLVPKYLIVESCGTYCVCSVDTENLPIIDTYETEKEAQKKLEKLYEEV